MPRTDVDMTKIKIKNYHSFQPTALFSDETDIPLEGNFIYIFSSLQYVSQSDSYIEAHSIQIIPLLPSEVRQQIFRGKCFTKGFVWGKKKAEY